MENIKKTCDLVNPGKISLDNYCDDGPIGCFLEVDLYYLDELHDLHNDYHFKTEKQSSKRKITTINYKS